MPNSFPATLRAWRPRVQGRPRLLATVLHAAAALLGVAAATVVLGPAHAGCLSAGSGSGPSYNLVKTTFGGTIAVALLDCTKDHTKNMTGLLFQVLQFNADPLVNIWSGSGDQKVHTYMPVTVEQQ